MNSETFKTRFSEVLAHDQLQFDEPKGWQSMKVADSPLIKNFDSVWDQLKTKYTTELSALAFSPIPDGAEIKKSIKTLVDHIK